MKPNNSEDDIFMICDESNDAKFVVAKNVYDIINRIDRYVEMVRNVFCSVVLNNRIMDIIEVYEITRNIYAMVWCIFMTDEA